MVTARGASRWVDATVCVLSSACSAEVAPQGCIPPEFTDRPARPATMALSIDAGYNVFGVGMAGTRMPAPLGFDHLELAPVISRADGLRFSAGPIEPAPIAEFAHLEAGHFEPGHLESGHLAGRATAAQVAEEIAGLHASAPITSFHTDVPATPVVFQTASFVPAPDQAGLRGIAGLSMPVAPPARPEVDPVLVVGSVVGLVAAGAMIVLAIVKLPR